MSLIKCPSCGKEISDKALACVFCGFPIKAFRESAGDTDSQATVVNELDHIDGSSDGQGSAAAAFRDPEGFSEDRSSAGTGFSEYLKRKALLIVIILLFAAIAVLGSLFVTKSNGPDPEIEGPDEAVSSLTENSETYAENDSIAC